MHLFDMCAGVLVGVLCSRGAVYIFADGAVGVLCTFVKIVKNARLS
jgi:hypothetical protein